MTNHLSLGMRVSGEYRCVLNEGTDREVDTGWRPNMVLDNGLDNIGNNVFTFDRCSVGTGSTAVSASQTSLVTYLAQKVSADTKNFTNLGASTYKTEGIYSYIFPQGTVVGNITEMGVGKGASGTNLFSRCLLVNGSNVPTALTVVALDQLTVYYKVIWTPVLTDITGSVTLSGTAYSYTGRYSNIGSSGGNSIGNGMDSNVPGNLNSLTTVNTIQAYPPGSTLGAITGGPSGTSTGASGTSAAASSTYTNGNFWRDWLVTIPVGSCNPAGGIGAVSIGVGWGGATQYVFGTTIPKDNTKTMTLVVRVSWSR